MMRRGWRRRFRGGCFGAVGVVVVSIWVCPGGNWFGGIEGIYFPIGCFRRRQSNWDSKTYFLQKGQ